MAMYPSLLATWRWAISWPMNAKRRTKAVRGRYATTRSQRIPPTMPRPAIEIEKPKESTTREITISISSRLLSSGSCTDEPNASF
jgi:hypothetical protein